MNTLYERYEFRAEQLCIMHFTRSSEIKLVRKLNDPFLNGRIDPNLDLLFDIDDDNFYSGYQFGVTLKAIEGEYQIMTVLANFSTHQYKNIAVPVLLVIFDIFLDKGYYLWINYPDAGRTLKTTGRFTSDKILNLNSKGLKEITTKVSSFYSN